MKTLQTPVVSIVIATYQAESCIRTALDSIMQQSFADWECIVVDGASSDSTIDIVKSYIEKDTRIRYICEKDKGIYDAYNKGWKAAKGTWVYYMGADDTLEPDGFSNLLKAETTDTDILYGDIHILFPNRSFKLLKPFKPSSLRYVMFTSHQALIMRRSVIEELGGFDLQFRIAADYDLLQRSFLAQKRFKYHPVWIANFSYAGVSSVFSYKKDKELLLIPKKNKANVCPTFFFIVLEIKRTIGFLMKKMIKKSI